MTTQRDKLLSALAMSRGAGKLQIGFDASAAAAQKGAPLIVLASDIAQRTKRNILQCCTDGTTVLQLHQSQRDIEAVVGRRFVVAAVTDSNFAQLIQQTYSDS